MAQTYQFKRSYRTHKSFLPMAVSYVEKKQDTLEKVVSFMALKHVLKIVKPEIADDFVNQAYLQRKVSGVEDIEGLYTFFMKKGLSQSEVTHRLKRVKFLKLVQDSIYIIPPIELITTGNEEIVRSEPIEVMVKPEQIARWKKPVGHISQAFTEFTKIARHSGYVLTEIGEEGRIFSGMGHKIILRFSVSGEIKLDIEDFESPIGNSIPYEKNSKNNYDHITGHTFGEFGYIMKQAGFSINKNESSKFVKVYHRNDYTVKLKWEEGITSLNLFRRITKNITENSSIFNI